MDHVVGARNSSNLDIPALRCLANTSDEGRGDLIWEGWYTRAGQIKLNTPQSMRSHRIEHVFYGRASKRLGKNTQVHHTPPVTSARNPTAPFSTKGKIARGLFIPATPSSPPPQGWAPP